MFGSHTNPTNNRPEPVYKPPTSPCLAQKSVFIMFISWSTTPENKLWRENPYKLKSNASVWHTIAQFLASSQLQLQITGTQILQIPRQLWKPADPARNFWSPLTGLNRLKSPTGGTFDWDPLPFGLIGISTEPKQFVICWFLYKLLASVSPKWLTFPLT